MKIYFILLLVLVASSLVNARSYRKQSEPKKEQPKKNVKQTKEKNIPALIAKKSESIKKKEDKIETNKMILDVLKEVKKEIKTDELKEKVAKVEKIIENSTKKTTKKLDVAIEKKKILKAQAAIKH